MRLIGSFRPFAETDYNYEIRLENIKEYCLSHGDEFPDEAIDILRDEGIDETWIDKYGISFWKRSSSNECTDIVDYAKCLDNYSQATGKQIEKLYPDISKYLSDEHSRKSIYHYWAHCENYTENFKLLGIDATHRGYGVYTAYITSDDMEKLETGFWALELMCLRHEYSDYEWAKWSDDMFDSQFNS